MQITQLISQLSRNDLKLIGRDSMLVGVLFFLVLIALVLRFGLPWLNTELTQNGIMPSQNINQYFSDFYPLVVAVMVLFNVAAMVGFVFGFILLDEKDDNTLKAMLVTPTPFNHYLIFRTGVPALLAFISVVGICLCVNQALVSFWQLISLALGACLMAPITLLILAILSENKMQGFVYGKFISLASWIIILSWFAAEPWQWVFGLFPPFLISKAYWMALNSDELWWLVLTIGIVLQLGLVYILVKVFNKIAYR